LKNYYYNGVKKKIIIIDKNIKNENYLSLMKDILYNNNNKIKLFTLNWFAKEEKYFKLILDLFKNNTTLEYLELSSNIFIILF
jgi:hypothetical protein